MARSRIVDLSNFQQFTAINVLADPGHIGGKVIIPQVMQVRMKYTLPGGKNAFMVTHANYLASYPGTVAMADAIFTAWKNLFTANAMYTFMPTSASTSGVDLRDLGVADQPLIASTGAPAAGTSVSLPLPTETAITLTLRTAKTGPGNRGRMYLAGFATNATAAGGVIDPTLMTNLGNVAGGWRSLYTGQGLVMVIAQPARAAYTGSTGTVHPVRNAGFTSISSIEVRDNHWDSQRRRGLK